MTAPRASLAKIAYLGPQGTFSEEALLSEPDLAECEVVACTTISEAITAAANGQVDAAFVPIENSIEGLVNATIDELVFGAELFIQREVVLEVHLDLLGLKGASTQSVRTIISFPHATAQCRSYLARNFPDAVIGATNSTADAARLVKEQGDPSTVAVAPPLAAQIYGLEVLAHGVEDHDGNQTRFVLLGREVVPPPSGHDRTTIVCFQHADRPGSLQEILSRFAARNINLTRIESRPTKQALGDYCFVIEIEGHVGDEVVGDALCELHSSLETLKFLGSYPVTGEEASTVRKEITEERREADAWLEAIRRRILALS